MDIFWNYTTRIYTNLQHVQENKICHPKPNRQRKELLQTKSFFKDYQITKCPELGCSKADLHKPRIKS